MGLHWNSDALIKTGYQNIITRMSLIFLFPVCKSPLDELFHTAEHIPIAFQAQLKIDT
jgi:hypothetical protein